MVEARTLRGKKRRGRLKQNEVVLQQLSNGQYLLTIPRMWVDLLGLQRGDAVTFFPTSNGIEVSAAKHKKRKP